METSRPAIEKMIEIANALTLQAIQKTYLKSNRLLPATGCGGGRWR